jgi:hypothetical protein
MSRVIDWRIFSGALAVASLVAFCLHVWLGLDFWVCLGLVVVCVGLNGIVAAIEDELPGGFHIPRPDSRRDEG